MAAPSDQQIIGQIQQGQREALGLLFDRYGRDLYDLIARVVGDREEAARLLGELFLRIPAAVADWQGNESVRALLYGLSREASLSFLRQKGTLDALPPLEDTAPASLTTDIWRAARAIPAFHRVVLVVEELHALSPTEKARAIGVLRTDLGRIVDEARRSFNRQFDLQARAQGRPGTAQLDPAKLVGIQRRIPNLQGSLFGFLPVLILPDSLAARLRSQIISGAIDLPRRPAPAATPPAPPPPVAPVVIEVPPPQTPPPVVVTTRLAARPVAQPRPRRTVVESEPLRLPAYALPIFVGVILALIVCGMIYYFSRDTTPPTIDSLDPPDRGAVAFGPVVVVTASYHDDRGIDPTRVRLYIDNNDVSAASIVTENAASYSGPLPLGVHSAKVQIADRSGNPVEQNWTFTVMVGPTPVPGTPVAPTLIGGASRTPSLVPITPLPPTATPSPIIITATPLPVLPSWTPSPTLIPVSATPCIVGILGTAYNDLNGNQFRDGGEPALSNVSVTLENPVGSPLATTITDAFGRFIFNNLPNGNYRVEAVAPSNFAPTGPTIVTATLVGCGAYTTVEFGFQAGTPTPTATLFPTQTPFIVTATYTFTPIATTTPSATPTVGSSLSGVVRNSKYTYALSGVSVAATGAGSAAATTNANGLYVLGPLLPGSYIISGSRGGYQNVSGPRTLNAGGNTYDFVLPPCLSIKERTLTPNTQLRGAQITLGYNIANACQSAVQVWLGGGIRQGGTSYNDPANDVAVVVPGSGSLAPSRLLTIPANAAPGKYDMEWTLWETKSGTALSGKYDGSDYAANVGVLTVVLPTPTATVTATQTKTP